MEKAGWLILTASITFLVIRIIVAYMFANKMEEIVNLKQADINIFAWSMILSLFCGLLGMLITVLMVISIPDCQTNNTDDEIDNITRYVDKL